MTPEECAFNNQNQLSLRYPPRHEIAALVGFVLLCLAAELAAVAMAVPGLRWALSLNAPALLPPGWLALPTGIAVYVMSGVAAWEIWRAPDVALRNQVALRGWGWQLGMKSLWVPLFFEFHAKLAVVAAGLATMLVLGFALVRFTRLNRMAVALMAPYSAWAVYELYLLAGFWWLNR